MNGHPSLFKSLTDCHISRNKDWYEGAIFVFENFYVVNSSGGDLDEGGFWNLSCCGGCMIATSQHTAQQCVFYEPKKLKTDMMFENSFNKFKCF